MWRASLTPVPETTLWYFRTVPEGLGHTAADSAPRQLGLPCPLRTPAWHGRTDPVLLTQEQTEYLEELQAEIGGRSGPYKTGGP